MTSLSRPGAARSPALAERLQTLRRLPDRPALTAAVSGLLALLFMGAVLLHSDGDISRLVHAGPPWTSARTAPGSLTVQAGDEAFDGQFFYRLGVSPLSTERSVSGVRFDLPALRNARWLYGGLAWLGSGGDPDLVPWALAAINLAAAVAVGGLAGALARDSGRHAGFGLLLALYPGFVYSMSLDTTELLAAAFLLAALLALRRGQWAVAALAFSAAVLTRDTTVVVVVGAAVAAMVQLWTARRRGPTTDPRPSGPLIASIVPLGVFAGWQLLQRARFGALPLTSSGDNNLSAPLRGLGHELGRSLPPSGGVEAFRLLSLIVLLATVVAAATTIRSSAAPLAEKLAWVPAVLVLVVLNAYLWSAATAFMRAGTEAYLLSGLVLLGSRHRWTSLMVLPVAGLWFLTAVAQVGKAG